jgi:hypothetical protein
MTNGTCPLIPPHDPGTSGLECSLVGRWLLNSSHGSVQSIGVIDFDAAGGYYGGPQGTNLDKTYVYDGYYTVSAGPSAGTAFFDLNYSCGDGCNGSSHFSLQFMSCTVARIQEISTQSCTGNRIVVAGTIILTRQ